MAATLLLAGTLRAEAPLSFLDGDLNLMPIAGLFALEPAPAQPGNHWRVDLRTASLAARRSRGNEFMLFDGETSRLSLHWQHQLSDRLSIAADLPYVWHTRGVLDPFIDSWHKTFGLPEGIRDDIPRDQLLFVYRDGDELFRLDRNTHGPGDVRLHTRYAMSANDRWSVTATLKLPTGDVTRLTGSGALDVNGALHWRSDQQPGSRWSFNASLGGAYLGDADINFRDQNSFIWTGHAAAGYAITERLMLGARVQMHRGVIESDIGALGDTAFLLVTGGSYRLSPTWQLNITVDEDVRVRASPDVTFRIGLQRLR
ncbi:MAG: DUF3187 family protein [Pseudomonadota bacterium]